MSPTGSDFALVLEEVEAVPLQIDSITDPDLIERVRKDEAMIDAKALN
jgi:hypothetical protein